MSYILTLADFLCKFAVTFYLSMPEILAFYVELNVYCLTGLLMLLKWRKRFPQGQKKNL